MLQEIKYFRNFLKNSLYRINTSKTNQIVNPKKVSKDIVIVLGGPFPSVAHTEILSDIESVDIVVRGEGEKTLIDLIHCIENGKQFDEVSGITYRTKEGTKINKPRSLIKDLNELPFPNYLFHYTYLHLQL